MELEPQENSSRKVFSVILVILILTAIVLSYFLYQKVTSDTLPYSPVENIPSTGSETPNTDTTPEGPFNFLPLSADERAVLETPDAGATEEELRTYSALIQKTAVASDKIAVGPNCRVSPVVLKTQKGKEIQLKNYDGIEHTLVFDATHSFSVPPRGSVMAPVDFGETNRVFGYGCDHGPSAVGLLLLSE